MLFFSSRCTCKQDYLLKLRLFMKIYTLLYIWVFKRIRWVRLLLEILSSVVFFFLYRQTIVIVSGDIFLSTLFKCLLVFTSSAFLFQTLSLDTVKTVRNCISQVYFIKTHFETWLKDLRRPVWLCYLINQAQSWFVLWGSSTGSAEIVRLFAQK